MQRKRLALALVVAVVAGFVGFSLRPGQTQAPARPPQRLPSYRRVVALNPKLVGYKRISIWNKGMGYHLGHLAPSLVLMVNNQDQVTGMEQSFPSTLPYQSWMDPKTQVYNAGVATYSQHLMFVPPSQITPTMPANLPSALRSFDAFKAVNGHKVVPYMRLKPFKPGVGSLWGPDGPALRILLSRKERVVGGVMGVPAKYGWHPWYDQPAGRPIHDPILGTIYTQTIYFVPRSSIK